MEQQTSEVATEAQNTDQVLSKWVSDLRKSLKEKSKNELVRLVIHMTIELYKEKEKNEKNSNNSTDSSELISSTEGRRAPDNSNQD